MEVEIVKKRIKELNAELLSAITKFESETGTCVTSVDVHNAGDPFRDRKTINLDLEVQL